MKVGELNALIKLDGKSQFDRDIDGAGRKLGGLGDTALRAGQSMATIGVAAGTAMLGLTTAVFKTGVEYNALQASSRSALETLLGSAEKANAQMDKLDDFAANSPFAKDVFIRAQQQMIGFGIEAENVIPILGAVQDATAAVGGGNQEISEIVTTLSKISSTGKITAQDLNELGNRGIDAAALMGDEFGKTAAEIRDDISNSRITADEAIEAITNQMSIKFGGAAADMKETFEGATDRVKAAWRDIGSELAAPFVDPHGGGRAIQWVNDFADVMRAMQAQVAPLMDIVMTRWAGQFDKITPYLQDLKDRIDGLDMSALNEGLDALDGYGGIIAGLAGAFTAWGTAALPIIGGINPIVAGVTALVLATPELRDGLDRVLVAAMPLVTEFGELGVQIADMAVKVITEFAPAFFDLAEAVVEAAIPLGGTMADAISGLLTMATPFIDLLSGIVSWMADLPDGVLLAGTAFLMLKDNMSPLRGVVDGVRGAFDNFNLQRHLAQMEGMSTNASLAGGAFGVMAIQAQRVGTALKTAFIANAPALAIAGLVTVISKIANSGKEAEERIDRLAASMDGVTDSANEAVRALVAEDLQNLDDWDQMVRVADEAGFSLDTYTDAVLGNADAQKIVADAMAGVSEEGYWNNYQFVTTAESGEVLSAVLAILAGDYEEAGNKAREKNEIVGDTSGTEEAIRANERLTEVLDIELQTIESLIDARRRERGEVLNIVDAQIQHADAREKLATALELEGNLIDENTGLYDGLTPRGEAANEAAQAYVSSMQEMADSLAVTTDEAEDIAPALQVMRDEFIEAMVAMDMSSEAANQLADDIGLIPGEVAIEAVLKRDGFDLTLEDLLIDIDESSGDVSIGGKRVKLDQTLAEIIGDVDASDGTVEINGNKVPAWLTVEELLGDILDSEEDVTVNADDSKGQNVLESFEGDVRGMEEFAKINATDDPAMNVLTGTERTIKNTQADMRVGANPTSLNNWVAGIAGKILGTSYVNIQPTGRANLLNHNIQADGSVLDFFADGGLREHHVAQIAPAGAWRVWAEPETGGEAYIPLALAKRSRSEAILAEVADRFGMMLIDTPRYFADGGTYQTPPGNRSSLAPPGISNEPRVVVNIGEINNPVAEPTSVTVNNELQRTATLGGLV